MRKTDLKKMALRIIGESRYGGVAPHRGAMIDGFGCLDALNHKPEKHEACEVKVGVTQGGLLFVHFTGESRAKGAKA